MRRTWWMAAAALLALAGCREEGSNDEALGADRERRDLPSTPYHPEDPQKSPISDPLGPPNPLPGDPGNRIVNPNTASEPADTGPDQGAHGASPAPDTRGGAQQGGDRGAQGAQGDRDENATPADGDRTDLREKTPEWMRPDDRTAPDRAPDTTPLPPRTPPERIDGDPDTGVIR